MNEEEKELEEFEECDHEWQFDTCDGGTHFFYCLNCDEELEEDCDCPEDEDEEEEVA